MRELEQELSQYQFTAYNPPRANHGPGWVFRFGKTFDGKTVATSVCDQLMAAEAHSVVKSGMTLPDLKRDHTFEAGLGLAFIGDLVSDVQKAEANLKSRAVTKLQITWGQLVVEEIPSSNLFTPTGKLIPVNPTCSVQLSMLKSRNELPGVFLVTEAIRADQLEIAIQGDKTVGVSGAVDAKSVLSLKPNISATTVDQSTIRISEPRYIGFRAFSIEDFVPTALLGAETARVSGARFPSHELRRLTKD